MRIALALGALTLAAAGAAYAARTLTLHPSGFGEHSYAAWKADEGLPDSTGDAMQALYFQKLTETFVFAAGIAEVQGAAGLTVSDITGLEWEHRTDGWCGAGAPRWTIISEDAAGDRHVTHLGCAAAAHSPGSAPNWIRDTQPSPGAEPCVKLVPPFPTVSCAANTVLGLFIIFDEGTTIAGAPLGQGFVHLDNIKVTTSTTGVQVWTSAADNGG
jgi:hypothetical protein